MKGRILIVEDHEAIAKTYKLMLESQGYEVTMTVDGDECIRKYDEQMQKNTESRNAGPFELVVVDYHLPGRDGIDVIGHILSAAPYQRILIASSYPKDVIERSAQSLQRSIELIQKPFELIDLVDAIEGRRAPEIIGGA